MHHQESRWWVDWWGGGWVVVAVFVVDGFYTLVALRMRVSFVLARLRGRGNEFRGYRFPTICARPLIVFRLDPHPRGK